MRLDGHRDFSTLVSVIRVEAKGTTRLLLKCVPTTTLPVQSRLVLQSRRDGGAHAATLVFQLQSKVDTRSPIKRIRTEGPLYELQQFDITVANPFPSDVDLQVSLLHEPAEPADPAAAAAAEEAAAAKRGGGRSRRKSSSGANEVTAERPKPPQIYPNSLAVDRPRFRLKQGGSDKLRGFFLPFTMGTHHLTLVFKDRELGEFVYEVVGEATLPAPLLEAKGTVPLEGPHSFNLSVPFVNSNLETAKKLFMDRHPLAKSKEQAAYIKDSPKPGSIDYAVSQTNSLITCPKQVTLTAGGDVPAASSSRATADGWSGGAQDRMGVVSEAGNSPPAAAAAAPLVPQGNVVPLAVKPIGPGVYPTRLLLTSDVDVRVVDLELMGQVLTQEYQLEFACPVRHQVTQEVPLVNASDQVGGGWVLVRKDVLTRLQ